MEKIIKGHRKHSIEGNRGYQSIDVDRLQIKLKEAEKERKEEQRVFFEQERLKKQGIKEVDEMSKLRQSIIVAEKESLTIQPINKLKYPGSSWNKGKHLSPEHIVKVKENALTNPLYGMRNRKHSPETIAKMRVPKSEEWKQSQKERWKTDPRCLKIIQDGKDKQFQRKVEIAKQNILKLQNYIKELTIQHEKLLKGGVNDETKYSI